MTATTAAATVTVEATTITQACGAPPVLDDRSSKTLRRSVAESADAEIAAQRGHARDVLADLDAWLGRNPERLPTASKAEVLSAIRTATAKLAAIELRLMGSAGDAARAGGHRDVAAWVASTTRTDTGPARAAQRTAQGLQSTPPVAAALSAGAINPSQAAAIVNCLDKLLDIPDELRRKAAERLIEHARQLPPSRLAARGKGILDEIDPAGAHQQLGSVLADEASRAWAATRIVFRDHQDGTTGIDGTVPTPVASRIKTVLEAFTSPRAVGTSARSAGQLAGRVAGQGTGQAPERVSPGQVSPPAAALGAPGGSVVAGQAATHPAGYPTKMGQALCALFEKLNPADLPRHGGASTTVIVTIDHREFMDDLGTATLLGGDGDGTTISAGEARRLACEAGIVPAVLGSGSQVLDFGRRARLFTATQVSALRVQDGHCRAEGCTIPGAWCEAHHLQPWSRGGATDLSNGILLCSFHHHLIHDPNYQHGQHPDRTVWFRLVHADQRDDGRQGGGREGGREGGRPAERNTGRSTGRATGPPPNLSRPPEPRVRV